MKEWLGDNKGQKRRGKNKEWRRRKKKNDQGGGTLSSMGNCPTCRLCGGGGVPALKVQLYSRSGSPMHVHHSVNALFSFRGCETMGRDFSPSDHCTFQWSPGQVASPQARDNPMIDMCV